MATSTPLSNQDAESLGYVLLIALVQFEKEYGLDDSLSNTLSILIKLMCK